MMFADRCGGLPISERPVVLFDFDGTIADTQPAIIRAVGAVLARRGYHLSEEQLLPLIGPPLEVGIRLVADMDEREAEDIAREYRDLFNRTVTPEEIPPLPGAIELLDALLAQGRRIAVATSRIESSANDLLQMMGIAQFEVVAGRVPGVRETKADSIEAALRTLGARPSEAVMVGDRMYDVLGAAEHGVPCIGLYSGAAAAGELERAGALVSCSSMMDVGRALGFR